MQSIVSLKDVTMAPISSEVTDFYFIQPPELTKGFPVVISRIGTALNSHRLGLERGDLKNYYETPMNSTKLRSDMIQLFKKKKWTLLPSQEDLEGLVTLCTHNRASSTSLEDRVIFTLNFPPREYTYQLLPPRITPADPEKEIFYVGDKEYHYPYDNLPVIKTSIHPAFVLPSVNLYRLLTYSPNPTKPPVINSVLHELIHEIMSRVHLAIPVGWLDGTWDDYDHRGLVLVRDYPTNPREKATTPPLEDGYVTPEERDVKPDDPRKVRREKKMEKFIEEHNQQRSTKVAKGAVLDFKAHQSATTPTPQVYKSEDVPKDPKVAKGSALDSKTRNATDAGPAKRRLTPEPVEEPVRKTQFKKSRSNKPVDQSTPPLRRSTRTRKITAKYT